MSGHLTDVSTHATSRCGWKATGSGGAALETGAGSRAGALCETDGTGADGSSSGEPEGPQATCPSKSAHRARGEQQRGGFTLGSISSRDGSLTPLGFGLAC